MIIDNLSNLEAYENIHPLFKQAFDFLKSCQSDSSVCNKIEIVKDDLFAIISNSELKNFEDAKLEVHNKYIDIQMPLIGVDTIGWKSRKLLNQPIGKFDSEKDIQFFEDNIATSFNLDIGNFAILFPEDAHAPCIGNGFVKKVVIKIKL